MTDVFRIRKSSVIRLALFLVAFAFLDIDDWKKSPNVQSSGET